MDGTCDPAQQRRFNVAQNTSGSDRRVGVQHFHYEDEDFIHDRMDHSRVAPRSSIGASISSHDRGMVERHAALCIFRENPFTTCLPCCHLWKVRDVQANDINAGISRQKHFITRLGYESVIAHMLDRLVLDIFAHNRHGGALALADRPDISACPGKQPAPVRTLHVPRPYMTRIAPHDATTEAAQCKYAPTPTVSAHNRSIDSSATLPSRSWAFKLDQVAPVSWKRLLMFTIPCFLLLTDVVRGGLSVQAFPDSFLRIEPNIFANFGPFAYPVVTINATEADNAQNKLWTYKQDTTSVAMRVAAKVLNVSTWPRCVLHKEPCASSTLGHRTVFRMLDALVDAIADSPNSMRSSPHRRAFDPITMATAADYTWLDRVHDHVLPQFFSLPRFRMNRYLYFSSSILTLHAKRGFCAMSASTRPHSCSEMWTHFNRVRTKRAGREEHRGDVWTDVSKRVRAFQDKYPSDRYQVDLLVLDSNDLHSKGRMSYRGSHYFDIVTILRARSCDRSLVSSADDDSTFNCTTAVVNEYRYEGGSETFDVGQWFTIVATLRVVGQTYMWLRVALLWTGSYAACNGDPSCKTASRYRNFLIATRTMFLVPAQVVIYGSFVPIVCYSAAHWIDSSATHERIANLSRTPATGLLYMDFQKNVDASTVLMRNVWPLALTLHLAIWCRTSRCWTHEDGVVGMTKYLISIMSALTTFAHYRFLSLRDASILNISLQHDNAVLTMLRARRNMIGGSLFLCQLIDLKMLLVVVLAATALLSLVGSLLRCFKPFKHSKTSLWTRSVVSRAGRALWPLPALAISWGASSNAVVGVRTRWKLWKPTNATTPSDTNQRGPDDAVVRAQAEAHVFLVNLCMLTDPVALWRTRGGSGVVLAMLNSHPTGQTQLVPWQSLLHDQDHDLDAHLTHRCVISSREVTWRDLLACG